MAQIDTEIRGGLQRGPQTPLDPQIDPWNRGGPQRGPGEPRSAPRSTPPATEEESERQAPPLYPRCRGLDAIQVRDVKRSVVNVVDAVRRSYSGAVDCGSLSSVVDRLVKVAGPRAGRQPELNWPPNAQQAQAELQIAWSREDVRDHWDRVARDIGADENLRLVFAAAVLQQHGFFNGRDRYLQELMRRID